MGSLSVLTHPVERGHHDCLAADCAEVVEVVVRGHAHAICGRGRSRPQRVSECEGRCRRSMGVVCAEVECDRRAVRVVVRVRRGIEVVVEPRPLRRRLALVNDVARFPNSGHPRAGPFRRRNDSSDAGQSSVGTGKSNAHIPAHREPACHDVVGVHVEAIRGPVEYVHGIEGALPRIGHMSRRNCENT